MHENFWHLFVRTGNIGAYLAYKKFLEEDEGEDI
jgi:predicted membrane channel-forming protein YqfA (hemolysin III family)